MGALQVQRRGALRQDARGARLRPHRAARVTAGARLRHEGDRLRRLRGRGALPRGRGGAHGHLRRAVRPGRFRDHSPPGHAGDPRLAQLRGVLEDEGRRPRDQRGPRRPPGGRGPEGGHRLGQGGGRRARRLPRGAGHRASALRPPGRGGDPAPRGLHRRGHRPCGLPGGGAGGGRPHRRHGHQRGERARHRRRGHGGAGRLPRPVTRPGPHRHRGGRGHLRGRARRWSTAGGSRSATRACSPSRC